MSGVQQQGPVRIAMWSGPRNISTAMMRAWENREDTVVWDEPLYAWYLQRTGLDHPGAAQVIAAGCTDWREVVARCTGAVPGGKAVHFQKHMAHHVLEEMDLDWLAKVTNCFLIRDPREVIASYARVRTSVTAEDIGIARQAELFDHVVAHGDQAGGVPVIIDSRDVLQHPEAMLRALCERFGTPFSPRMMQWPAGARDSDGVWAKYWYGSVEKSTGFEPWVSKSHRLAAELQPLAERCMADFKRLHAARLRP